MNRNTLLSRTAIAGLVLAGSLTIGGTANADVMAQSILNLSNFEILLGGSTSTTILTNGTDVSVNSASNKQTVSPSLEGSGTTATKLSASPGQPINIAQQCHGSGCTFSEDDYTKHTQPATGTFARGDANLTGASIAGLGYTTPATSNQVSEFQTIPTGFGNTSSDTTLNANAQFTSGTSDSLTFQFNADPYLYAFTSSDAIVPPSNAQASLGFSIDLSLLNADGSQTPVFSWSPNGQTGSLTVGGTDNSDPFSLNVTRSSTSAGSTAQYDPTTTASSNLFSATTPNLISGQTYTLSFSQTTSASGQFLVPEPSSLLIIAGGLLGLGMMSRRKARHHGGGVATV